MMVKAGKKVPEGNGPSCFGGRNDGRFFLDGGVAAWLGLVRVGPEKT